MAVRSDTLVILLPPFSTRIAATIPLVATIGCAPIAGRATIGRRATAGHAAHATAGHAAHAAAGHPTHAAAMHSADEQEGGLGDDGIGGRGTRKGAISRWAATTGAGIDTPATAVSIRTGANLYMCPSLLVVSRGMSLTIQSTASLVKFFPLRRASSLTRH